MHIGALYFAAFLHTGVFVSLLISLLEQFALPGKRGFARQLHDAHRGRGASAQDGEHGAGSSDHEGSQDDDTEETPTETTPLRAGDEGYGSSIQMTFASTCRRYVAAASSAPEPPPAPGTWSHPPYPHEQPWSGRLPTWTWFVQLLLLAPAHVIMVGNLSLVNTTSTAMTGTDGSSLLAPLMGVGVMSMLLLLLLTPFIHRITHHIPVFLVVVFVRTLIYNLVAFPFSTSNRFKFRFQQTVDLDAGTNVVTLSGLEEFVRPVIVSMPAAAGQEIRCNKADVGGLADCQYDASALPPDPADGISLENLVSVKMAKAADARTARVQIDALNTRTCYLDVSQPIFGFSVEGGGARDDRFGALPRDGFQHLRIWRRTWDGQWNVTLQLTDDVYQRVNDASAARVAVEAGELRPRSTTAKSALEVAVRCVWDDANKAPRMPALHELMRFMPGWAAVTKRTVGLVQVKKMYKV